MGALQGGVHRPHREQAHRRLLGLDLAGNIQWYAANWLVVHRRTKAGYAQDQQALVLVVTDPLLRSAPDQAGAPQPIRAGGVRDDKDVGTESA